MTQLLRDALELLEVRNLVLTIQEPSLPGLAQEDPGRGALGSRGTAALLETASALGFNGLQLGPMGVTSPGNPSPYDSTLFSRSPLGVALLPLVEEGLLSKSTLEKIQLRRPDTASERVPYAFVHEVHDAALD